MAPVIVLIHVMNAVQVLSPKQTKAFLAEFRRGRI